MFSAAHRRIRAEIAPKRGGETIALFWRDRPSALRAIRIVLRPGGLLATTYQPRHRGAQYSDAFGFAEQLKDLMDGLAFTDIRTEKLDLPPVPAICVLGGRGE